MDMQELFGRDSIHTALKRWQKADKLGKHELAELELVKAQMVAKGYGDSARGKGLALREVLTRGVAALGPDEGEEFEPWDKKWRAYVVLEERFKQRRSPDYVAEYMGLGRSAYYREQSAALERLGEWLQAAERTLQAELVEEIAEEMVAVETRPWQAPFLVPPLPAHPIVGRETLLGELREQLTGDDAQPLWALHGLPGGGKTALTLALAHDDAIQTHYPDGILWVALGPQPDILALLGTWCLALGLDAGLLPQMTTDRQRMQYIQATIGLRRMLLIIDDAWRIEEALSFKVGGANCAHVLTTRLPEVAFSFANNGVSALQELSVAEGLALLSDFAAEAIANERDLARDLVKAVGGLPLALVLVGHHLQKEALRGRSRRVARALTQLQQVEKRLSLSQPQSPLERSSGLSLGATLSLMSAIGMSDEALAAEAQVALRLLSIFPPKPNSFAEEAALAVGEMDLDALDGLVDAGLLEFVEPDRYMMHQSIADYARAKIELEQRAAAEERFATFFGEYGWEQRDDFQALSLELDNILLALSLAEKQERGALLVRG
ncbi:MAG TPA: NB-ARC domain-containing protein, partial [Anaerolineae bacterium]|nr:NB-ARC domain-containing protein [Anaerolineae bacterium]